jgi:hypothetical protein
MDYRLFTEKELENDSEEKEQEKKKLYSAKLPATDE